MRGVLEKAVKDRHFKKAMDLGTGEGWWAPVWRTHSDYLIGVDHDFPRLQEASLRGLYDDLVEADVLEYEIPGDIDAVFCIEVIEHLEKDDGWKLLEKLENVPFVLITTPAVFHEATRNGHRSLWTFEDFQSVGYETSPFRYNILNLWRPGIMALKTSLPMS